MQRTAPLAARAVDALAEGLRSAGSVTLQIPANTAPGSYQIIAKSDGNDSILEYVETNNTRTKAITITAPPQP